uniref:UDP-glucuronic acid decarboxylase 1 n=1 Tax=Physcomitrium patens TaxID=3218 RepID=A0A7I4A5R5_PHYPA
MNATLNHRRVDVTSENEKYTPKPQKQWSMSNSVEYVLREQRFVFVLVGVAITTAFFLFLQPEFGSGQRTMDVSSYTAVQAYNFDESYQTTRTFETAPYKSHRSAIVSLGGKIPLGLPRKPLRIVVTGGAGFVGSHLVDRLIERGDSVIVVDNFFTGRKENVQHHFGNPRFELIRHDVVEPLLLEVDQIYHLACPASPVHYKFNPIKTIKTNVVGTLNMLGLAKRIGARFLLTSTSEVYGDPLEHPQKETYWGNVNPIGVRSCYDEGKRTAETLAMDYHRGADVQVRIARIFNTYGPRMCIDDGRVVSNFVAQALRKEPMTVYGDGKQTRSFQFVSDLVGEGHVKVNQ